MEKQYRILPKFGYTQYSGKPDQLTGYRLRITGEIDRTFLTRDGIDEYLAGRPELQPWRYGLKRIK